MIAADSPERSMQGGSSAMRPAQAHGPREDPIVVVHRWIRGFADEHGVTLIATHALIEIAAAARADRPVTAGQLATILNRSTGSVSGLLDRLEDHGLIQRRRSSSDRRVVTIHPHGEDILDTAPDPVTASGRGRPGPGGTGGTRPAQR